MVENAKAVIGLSEFSIQTQYLSDGKLKVNNEKVTTAFKAEFILSRDLLSSGQFEAGNCTVSIIYTESPNYITQATSNNNYENDPSTIVLATKNVTSSDYNNGAVALMVDSRGKSTSCILPASKFLGKILLRIKYYDTSLSRDITVYSTTRYEIYVPHLTKIQSMGFSISGIKDFNSTYYGRC
ncbi:hypothetical protein Pedsa_3798 [Pseudopedobacter saltans DSM 12145]|uniref:Uncharacterized protein n=2 Tax=Pseudopedobacter saltans TaxID=151895 RepID=F0S754_PSESL|nr:hypothetical protein Pedsa_3798 [Pseudopedobacter saltans DSM 12145]